MTDIHELERRYRDLLVEERSHIAGAVGRILDDSLASVRDDSTALRKQNRKMQERLRVLEKRASDTDLVEPLRAKVASLEATIVDLREAVPKLEAPAKPRAEPVPPKSHGLMADFDPTLMQ